MNDSFQRLKLRGIMTTLVLILVLCCIAQFGLSFGKPQQVIKTLELEGSENGKNFEMEPLEWWQETVIYQVYPRSFQDSDGDGIGDINGITSRVDYFVELGVEAVWISPIYKSPMVDFGYDISNFTDIDPIFGNLEDFKRLSEAFKNKGIKLIMDFVPNHSSDQHVWFEKSINQEGKYSDYFVWRNASGFDADGGPKVPNNWVSVFGGSMWTWNDKREQFYLHQFTKEQPDLNFENNDVWNEILAAVKFWLDMGVDGFRVDAVPHLFEDQEFQDEPLSPGVPPDTIPTEHWQLNHIYTVNLPKVLDFLAQMRRLLDIYTMADGKIRCMMVEAAVPSENLIDYYGTKTRPIAHFPFNFNMLGARPENNARQVLDLLNVWHNIMPEENWLNMLTGNHDNPRVTRRFTREGVDAANMLNLLVKATSVTYNGEEIGMENKFLTWEETQDPAGCGMGPDRYMETSRDPARTPMQWDNTQNAGFSTANKTWLPIHENYVTINVKTENEAEESHIKVYKELMKLRGRNVWKYGDYNSFVLNDDSILGFTRTTDSTVDDISFVVLANMKNTSETVDLSGFDYMPATATVLVRSVGFEDRHTTIGSEIDTDKIPLGPRNSIVLTFPSTLPTN